MLKVINIIFSIVVLIFIYSVLKYYISNTNIKDISLKREKIQEVLKIETAELLKLKSDTSDVIEYNSGFTNEIKKKNPRNFWNLFEKK